MEGDHMMMGDALRARAMDLANWISEQRYHQGFSERVARRAEAILRAAVEAERERCIAAAKTWLRAQANAERRGGGDAAAWAEAHNAIEEAIGGGSHER